MEADPIATRKRSSEHAWLWVVVAVLLYVLSIGPVAKISVVTHASPGTEKMLGIIYSPVLKGAEWTGQETVLDSYLKLWGVD